jgi:O-antigen/teichoic acid export membrane protein
VRVTAAVGLSISGGETLARAERSALGVLAIRIAGAGLAYGTQVLLARLMGKAEYGIFATVWVWVTVLGHGSLWGLSQSICRFVPHYRVRGELDRARGFLTGGLVFAVLSALGLAVAGLAALWLGAEKVGASYAPAFLFALAILPLFALQDYAEAVARSFNWTTLAIAPPYLIRQGLLGLGMVAAILLGLPAEPWVALASMLVATAVSLLVQAALLVGRLRRTLPQGPRTFRLREWVSATVPIGFVDMTSLGLTFVDVLLLGLFLPPAEVGVYFAATRILQFVVFVQYAASAATAQRFAEARSSGDEVTLRALVARTARLTAVSTTAVGAALLGAAPLLLALFGPGFSASFGALAILVAGIAAQSAFGPAEDVLKMLGAERLCAAIAVAALGVAVSLNLALIPAFGITGAALAMAATMVLRGVALAAAARLRLGIATHVLA